SHAIYICSTVAIIIIPVCISACLTNVLAKQIDRQRLLLKREARRNERLRKRERHRIQTATCAVDRSRDAKGLQHKIVPATNLDEKPPHNDSSTEQPRKEHRADACSALLLSHQQKNKRRGS
ncbi:hypothetical protein NECAME_14958, partial [Necator americanus]